MQVYKAPLKDYKFLIKDFLNSGSTDSVFKNSDLNPQDLDMILEEAAKLCEEILLPINQSGDIEGCLFNKGKVTTPTGLEVFGFEGPRLLPGSYRLWLGCHQGPL